MKKEDIIRKLTSRKFWLAVAAFVTELIVVFRGGAELAESVTAIIMAGATVIAYIVGEGLIDAEAKDDGMSPQLVLYNCSEDDISPRNNIIAPSSNYNVEDTHFIQPGSKGEPGLGSVAGEAKPEQTAMKTGKKAQGSYAYFVPVVDGVQGKKAGV